MRPHGICHRFSVSVFKRGNNVIMLGDDLGYAGFGFDRCRPQKNEMMCKPLKGLHKIAIACCMQDAAVKVSV